MATSTRLAILSLGGVLLLSGCSFLQPTTNPTSSAPTSEVTESSTPTADPIPTSTDAASTPLTIDCATLVSDQVIYDWGSGNWGLDPAFKPPAGSSAAAIVSYGGTACGWVNLTSNEELYVAAAYVTGDQQATIEGSLKSSGDAVSTFGAPGYFGVSGGTGQADAFANGVWISARSTSFLEAGDAQPIMTAAVAAAG